MRTLQTFFGLATGGDILHHSHEVAHRAALIGDGGNVGAQPQTRAVGQHVPELNGEALAGLDGLLQQITQVGGIFRDGEILIRICSSCGAGRRTISQSRLLTRLKRPAMSIWAMPTIA